MAYGAGAITVVAEVASIRLAPVLSTSETARRYPNLFHLSPEKNYLGRKRQLHSETSRSFPIG